MAQHEPTRKLLENRGMGGGGGRSEGWWKELHVVSRNGRGSQSLSSCVWASKNFRVASSTRKKKGRRRSRGGWGGGGRAIINKAAQ